MTTTQRIVRTAALALTLTAGIILAALTLSAVLPHAADADTVPTVKAQADADLAHEAGVQDGYAQGLAEAQAAAAAQAAQAAADAQAAQAAQAAEIARLTAALAVKPTTVTKTVKVPTPIPVCHEDEAVTPDGLCVPMDGADYVGGVGWVPLPGTKVHPSL